VNPEAVQPVAGMLVHELTQPSSVLVIGDESLDPMCVCSDLLEEAHAFEDQLT
jgi:histidinol dehydrogenase